MAATTSQVPESLASHAQQKQRRGGGSGCCDGGGGSVPPKAVQAYGEKDRRDQAPAVANASQ
ncbi:uncharacterized protein ColSpa_01263 [Colletotrichum spaethianum]|uniref:Uncharacterized protein n=1 Tax=Colletotrichum spaethianum TaxID=700344 RepID=A0AA37LB31_9PEZI|nr:uncharacterized protein ColSpa_01263 [Colletotrichum spaethianum]GKT41082.1 hypothetical protein ColSpa_01263 [Colletotrichum spaethianum]